MTHLSFAFSWPALIVGLLFIVAAAWLSWQQVRRTGGRRRIVWLEALRWTIVLLLFLTLLQPEWRQLTPPTDKPEVVILCDRSRSMETEDVMTLSNTLSRAAWLSKQRASEFWKPIESRYIVKVEDFAAPPTNAADDTAEEGTDINGALEKTLAGSRPLRAVVLLTDGDWNLGSSPATAATRLQVGGVPVFAVGVGSEQYLPDLALTDVSAPTYGLVGEQVFIPFTVRSHLDRDVTTRIRLLADGVEAASKELIIPAQGQVLDGVAWRPARDGATALTLTFPVEPEERRADNNARDFTINVRRETLRVLVIDSLPRWEYRFLRNALSRDPSVEVKCLLFHPGMGVGVGRDYLDRFPETKDQLSAFDVVFLGDVGIGGNELTAEQVELLKGLVEQQGSGLVFIPGRRGRQATLAGTGLESLYPVQLDASKPLGILMEDPAVMNLTHAGRRHLLTTLADREDVNALVWQTLPGFTWCAGVAKARPGSDVLGVHASLANENGLLPLLVTRPAGNGKTLFLGTDSAWRWRRGVEDRYHYRFWGQVVRWMSYQRHRAHDNGYRLAFTPDSPAVGETVTLHATVFDSAGLPMSDAAVAIDVRAPKGQRFRRTLAAVPGGWGVYKDSFVVDQRGRYRIEVSCDKTERTMEAELDVRGIVREEVGRPAQPESLKEVAGITSGQYGTPADLPAFIRTLAAMPEPEPLERRARIWANPWWGVLLLLLLTVYWIGRKLEGLI